MSTPTLSGRNANAPLPATAGIGLRSAHHQDFLATRPNIGWVEVHSENFFGDGGAQLDLLAHVRADYPVSFHGVGLSLGSADPVDVRHLEKLRRLVHRFQPALVSEHLSWGSVDGRHLNDLLPIPFTSEALALMAGKIDRVQSVLGRQILIENISSYLQFNESEMSESDFLGELARVSGCGILLDVNNVYVSACNHGFDAFEYIENIPAERIEELHLAGHSVRSIDGRDVLIDTHDRLVCDDVWALFEKTIARLGVLPTLIEWDASLPRLSGLLAEASKAEGYLRSYDVAA